MKKILINKEELEEIVPSNQTFKIEDLHPFLVDASRDHIIPILGGLQYDKLFNFYNGGISEGELTEKQVEAYTELLELVQQALVNLSYWIGFPQLEVQISNIGISIASTDRQSPLSQARAASLRDSMKGRGFKALEQCLVFLEKNTEIFTDWAESEVRVSLKKHSLNTASEFNEFVFINKSRLVFMKLIPHVLRVEKKIASKILGKDTWKLLKKYLKDGEVGAVERDSEELFTSEEMTHSMEELFELFKPIVAYKSFAEGVLELSTVLSDEGLFQYQDTSNAQNIKGRNTASKTVVDAIEKKYSKRAKDDLEELKTFFENNRSSYPPFKSEEDEQEETTTRNGRGVVFF